MKTLICFLFLTACSSHQDYTYGSVSADGGDSGGAVADGTIDAGDSEAPIHDDGGGNSGDAGSGDVMSQSPCCQDCTAKYNSCMFDAGVSSNCDSYFIECSRHCGVTCHM